MAPTPAGPCRAAAIRLVQGLALLVTVGTLALMLPGVATSGRLSFSQAIFTATSAASVAGLSVITPAEDLTWLGQLVLMLLIQAGGVGFMMLAVFMMLALGRRISLADRLALQDFAGPQPAAGGGQDRRPDGARRPGD